MRHLVEPFDLSHEETVRLLDVACSIASSPELYTQVARNKILATLFFEPSTRTRLSHETAMLRLGGSVIGFPSEKVSSVSKGETIADTIRVISCYVDIAAIRHPAAGSAQVASHYSRIPIINAGDGSNEHPTQTLLDLMTIRNRLGRLDHFTIGFCGDLKYGRTVHSLVKSLTRQQGVRFVFISPEELRMPRELLRSCVTSNGMEYLECDNLDEAIGDLDVLYMTRIQQERFADEAEYQRFKGVYILDGSKMKLAKERMAVLHPLPRVDEITMEVDEDPRAAYFEQVQNGLYVRMAVIMALLNIPDPVSGVKILSEEESV